MKTYKGFKKDLTCRGFQYEVGKEYEIEGNIEMCEKGFHACESPLEVFDHYNMIDSRFCEVDQSGEIKEEEGSTKICSSKIQIVAALKLADMIKLGVEWLKEITSPEKFKSDCESNNDNGKDSAQIGSSGDSAQIGSSGDYAQIGSSGYSAKIDSTGEDSVICCAGHNSKVKAKKGSWITLAEWGYDNNKKRNVPKCVKTEFVDGERIKADTWYVLKDGEFNEY